MWLCDAMRPLPSCEHHFALPTVLSELLTRRIKISMVAYNFVFAFEEDLAGVKDQIWEKHSDAERTEERLAARNYVQSR